MRTHEIGVRLRIATAPRMPTCDMLDVRYSGKRSRGAATEVERSDGNDSSGAIVGSRIILPGISQHRHFARKYSSMGTPAKPPFSKGRFGGNVSLRISPAFVTSLGNTVAWRRRQSLPFSKGRFGGNVSLRISPALVISLGNTVASGHRRNPSVRGSYSPRSGGKVL